MCHLQTSGFQASQCLSNTPELTAQQVHHCNIHSFRALTGHLLSTCCALEIHKIHHYCLYSAVGDACMHYGYAHILWKRIKQGKKIRSTEVPFKEWELGKASLLRGYWSKAGKEVPLYTHVSFLSCFHEESVPYFTKDQPFPFFLSFSRILDSGATSLSCNIHLVLFSGIMWSDTNMR